MKGTTVASSLSNDPSGPLARRLLRFGWWALLASLSLGLALEALHGFKVGWYLDADHDTRRLMFTLAHAHGALLGLVCIAAALTSRAVSGGVLVAASTHALIAASILLPVGFFFGGLIIHDGDPGLGILLVPLGALALLYAVASIARAVSRADRVAVEVTRPR